MVIAPTGQIVWQNEQAMQIFGSPRQATNLTW